MKNEDAHAFFLDFSKVNECRSFRSPRASSKDYFDFTSEPSLWLRADQKTQMEIQICLKWRKTEFPERPFEPPPEPDSIDASSTPKEEALKPSCSNHRNFYSNLEYKVEAPAIEDFDLTSSGHRILSGPEVKE